MNAIGRRSNYWQNVFFGSSALIFEEKLLLSATLFMAFFCMVYVFANLAMGLNQLIVFSSFAGFLVSLILYLFFRFKSRPKYMYFVTAILLMVYFDMAWLLNYGSNGPMFLFFIVLYAFIVLLFYTRYYLYFTALLIINVSLLFLIEYYWSGVIGDYPDYQSKLIDNYLGFLISILIILFFLASLKRKYIQEFERAKKSDQLKSAFLANMSHEIRTPLNAIVGFSSLIVDETISEKDRKEFIDHILHNSDSLLNLIGDIVDVSKVESNQLEFKIEILNVVPIIGMLVQKFQSVERNNKDLNIIDGIEDASILLKVDKLKFEQVLRHLLSNAVKYTEKGFVKVGFYRSMDSGVIWVKDTGCGIESSQRNHIFERFFKVEKNRNQMHRGTGIGLFLAKRLIEEMGGKIWFESEPGKGSTFYFSLPM